MPCDADVACSVRNRGARTAYGDYFFGTQKNSVFGNSPLVSRHSDGNHPPIASLSSLLFPMPLAAFFTAAATLAFSAVVVKPPPANPSTDMMTLELLDNTTCLDGTKAGYYYSPPASGGDSTTWVIYLQGGGSCMNETECTTRAETTLGSSKQWSPTLGCEEGRDGLGDHVFLCQNATANPSFSEAHHVFVPYGTGDAHRGTRAASAATWGLHFTGHTNLMTILQDLEKSHGLLSQGKHVLVTGGSAGAVGTFINVDYVKNAMLSQDAVVKANPNAGVFYPFALPSDFPLHPAYPPSNYSCFAAGKHCGLSNMGGSLAELWGAVRVEGCESDQAPGEEFLCDSVSTMIKYIKSSIYIVENQWDEQQITARQGCPLPTTSSPPSVLQYLKMYGEAMRNTTAKILRPGDGLFSPSCFQHIVPTSVHVRGYSWKDLVADWFWETKQYPADAYVLTETCPEGTLHPGFPCNPHKSCTHA